MLTRSLLLSCRPRRQRTRSLHQQASTAASLRPEPSRVTPAKTRPSRVTPATGYHVADVAVDGVSVGAVSTYTFTYVNADHTISAHALQRIRPLPSPHRQARTDPYLRRATRRCSQGAQRNLYDHPESQGTGWRAWSLTVCR